MELRRYIRHPSDIPIEYAVCDGQAKRARPLADIGMGGLSFQVQEYLTVGQHLQLRIPSIRPDLQIQAVVSWCDRVEAGYQVGIRFLQDQDRFIMRMVEQVCHIEAYRQKIQTEEGRRLSATEAACEWIKRFAEDFAEDFPDA
ncbi:MAG: PilZ domain-containing protein [Gammaproteobacteria bacterium]